jgi:hypothetical protein
MRVYDVGARSTLVRWDRITPPLAAAVDAAVLGVLISIRGSFCVEPREPFARFDERPPVDVAAWPILEP